MCLIVFAYNEHPKYNLILAANRDEFYDRPARGAQFWEKENLPYILAGKDMQAGGTWFGVHKDGRWAVVTNFRGPNQHKVKPPSRGELILSYLKAEDSATDFLQKLDEKAEEYNGFNLLLGDNNGIFAYSNQSRNIEEVEPGIHGLSNAFLDTDWPKVKIAKTELKKIILEGDITIESLLQLLRNDKKASGDELPDTGISLELERIVSPIFIKSENYGTRCSTLLLIDKNGNVQFAERTFNPASAEIHEENTFTFQIK